MARAIVVVGGVDEVRREMDRQLRNHARLTVIRLARSGGFRLEPHPDNCVQMLEAAADVAQEQTHDLSGLLVIALPYAKYEDKVTGTIDALEQLGAKVLRPKPNDSGWPSRPKALDARFRLQLQGALLQAVLEWLPAQRQVGADEGDAAAGINRARVEFAATLEIPGNIAIATSLDGAFWYRAFAALHELCLLERRGEATNKRELLRVLLKKHLDLGKGNYKAADTGVYLAVGGSREPVHLRERVHLREGQPTETESVYWATVGKAQPEYRYLIGRIGRHA